jgi:phosphoribosylaminoimidazolecarboxamide formyltransferase/IMP cyclohydrolase
VKLPVFRILDGRVKTLHPKIHGGILAMDTDEHRAQCEETGIDLSIWFASIFIRSGETIAKENVTFEEAIENIDIGGPTMVRSAAKNHSRVTVVVNPANYPEILPASRKKALYRLPSARDWPPKRLPTPPNMTADCRVSRTADRYGSLLSEKS